MARELSHKIELVLTATQEEYCKKACGTTRKVWNWALDKWNAAFARGEKPSAMNLKKEFNALKYQEFPWLEDIHRDAHSQPFQNLSQAWSNFFKARKAGNRKVGVPQFKKKGKCSDSFYIANDKFRIEDKTAVLPKIGEIKLRESLRFEGKILSGTVSRQADKWFLSVAVEVSEKQYRRQRTGNGVVGIDLGCKTSVTTSRGEEKEKHEGPKPLKRFLSKIQKLGKSISRKYEAAKASCGVSGPGPHPHVHILKSRNQAKEEKKLARLYRKTRNLRQDFLHQLTTKLCRENQAIGLETLNVAGMVQNRKLARSIADIGMGEFARQLIYKAERYGTLLVFADPWFPSSKTCSNVACGFVLESLPLSVREWTCPACGTFHDRDFCAAENMENLAWSAIGTPLPAASGKVTPVRHEDRLQKASGQELLNCALLRT